MRKRKTFRRVKVSSRGYVSGKRLQMFRATLKEKKPPPGLVTPAEHIPVAPMKAKAPRQLAGGEMGKDLKKTDSMIHKQGGIVNGRAYIQRHGSGGSPGRIPPNHV